MPGYRFETVDVFTDTRFGGNPLAVFLDGKDLSDAAMQALAAEMNLSETTFVLPPSDPANTARVRIFNRTAEMPFAGHPNVGTAFVLARQGRKGDSFRFEEPAGLVEVRLLRRDGALQGAEIDAPQPLSRLGELPRESVAACLGLLPNAVLTARHPPVRASVGVEFVLAEVAESALAAASPDLAAFRRTAAEELDGDGDRLSIFFYSRPASGPLSGRMFAPLSGTWEDPATGSANATLAALLLSLGDEETLAYEAVQGVEMGRPSRLSLRAWREGGAIRASVGGACVPVFSGRYAI
jgi:trans-2,3-dihydro-3-hydroxyanthranilate isomerase